MIRVFFAFFVFYAVSLCGQESNTNGKTKQIIWQTVLNVKDTGGVQLDLTFGQATDATDTIDTWLGEQELPPYPPSGVFDARFLFPAPYQTSSSWKDYRNTSSINCSWQVRVQPGSGGYPVTYTWDKYALPPLGTIYLKDLFGGLVVNINMRHQTSFRNTNSALNPLKIEWVGGSVSIKENEAQEPYNYTLLQNYPNPFNPETVIRFHLDRDAQVSLTIYDLLGKETVKLVNERKTSGDHQVKWNAAESRSGVYFCELKAGNIRTVKKLILIK